MSLLTDEQKERMRKASALRILKNMSASEIDETFQSLKDKLDRSNQRIKELEQERDEAEVEATELFKLSESLGVCSEYLKVNFCNRKSNLKKRDLEQQAIILENMVSEIGVAPMVPIDDPHCCAVAHNDVLSYMDAEAKQLRKQAEDL